MLQEVRHAAFSDRGRSSGGSAAPANLGGDVGLTQIFGYDVVPAGDRWPAYALSRLGPRLPVRTFFAVTGIVLMLLAVIFAGNGIRGLQTAGQVSATAMSGFPESAFLQLYLGLFR